MAWLEDDWYDAPLPDGVRIGDRAWVYSSYAFLHCRSRLNPCVRIGADTGIYDGTMFELGPQGNVRIGRYCSIVAAVIRTNGPVVVEDYALVSWNVFISTVAGDAPQPPSDADGRTPADPPLVIGEGAWVGAGAMLLPGSSVGRNAIVGAGAVLRQPVPEGAVVAGNPARIVARR